MGAIGLAGTAAKVVRPLADAVRTAESIAHDGGQIDILPGDPAATARIREILGVPAPGPSEDALAVLAVTATTDLSKGAPALAHRRRSGGGALALIVGEAGAGADVERRLLEEHRLEMSNIAHITSLEGSGEKAAIDAILRVLGDEQLAAGRRNPGLRPAVARELITQSSRRSAAIGALPLPGVDMPVLVLIQVRLVAQLAALHDRPMGAERVLEALAIVGAGFGWRAIGRSAAGLVPVAGWAVRGSVAYVATRAVGEAALARLQAGHDLIEGAPLEKVRPLIDRVTARFRR